MIEGQKELNNAILNRNNVIFEQKPLDFGPYFYEQKNLDQLPETLAYIVNSSKGINEVRQAVNKLSELKDHELVVEEAFRKF